MICLIYNMKIISLCHCLKNYLIHLQDQTRRTYSSLRCILEPQDLVMGQKGWETNVEINDLNH